MGVWPLNGVNRSALYQVKLQDSPKELLLALLVEHKSAPDKNVTIQMGLYIFTSLWQQVSRGKPPIPVLPILFYHGREPMPYHTHRAMYADYNEAVRAFIPEYDYVYHNLQERTEDELLAHRIDYWKAVLLLMKYAWEEDFLTKRAQVIFTFVEPKACIRMRSEAPICNRIRFFADEA